jgi:hypothetical protein
MPNGIHRFFGRPRPSRHAIEFTQPALHSMDRFRPLPPPTGEAPFHLDLAEIVDEEILNAIVQNRKLVFHIVGDLGGIKYGVPQRIVANKMEEDFKHNPANLEEDPAFFYGLGDCVYFNGQASEYFGQFYQPYEHYMAPIFAVPGNHDGDNIQPETSLEAFVRNFCSPQPVRTPEAGESLRTAMTQPNIFWTLITPFATIVGLYSNVPEQGRINEQQQEWLESELRNAPEDKPLFLTMHHPVFSADDHHSGSGDMKEAIDQAIQHTGRQFDIVFGGHVHNYQRFTRFSNDWEIPYIIAGAGGYHNLHKVATINGNKLIPPFSRFIDDEQVTLNRYLDDRHGFLRIEISGDIITGKYFGVPRPQESWSSPARLFDFFKLNWRTHTLE